MTLIDLVISWILCGKGIAMAEDEAIARWKIDDLLIITEVVLIRKNVNNLSQLGSRKVIGNFFLGERKEASFLGQKGICLSSLPLSVVG